MIDPVDGALASLASHSPTAYGLLFVAGAFTSIGPCVAPRYIAVTAIAGGGRRSSWPIAAFVAGLITAYAALGYAAGWLGRLWSWSSTIDLALAIGLCTGGALALVRAAPGHAGGPCCGGSRHAKHQAGARPPRSLGAAFLLGAASVLVVSPCCTPVIAAIVGVSTAVGKPLEGALLLVSFACGHALPLALAGHAGTLLERLAPRGAIAQIPAIVSAVLMLALGAYYGLLA